MPYQSLINPYYDPEKCGLILLSFEEPGLSYEYNILCFWASPEGYIYTAQDSGCSCPTPFENAHARKTPAEVIETLERVGSPSQAFAAFDSWNQFHTWEKEEPSKSLGPDERRRLEIWLRKHFKI